jgi:hypothetical protein
MAKQTINIGTSANDGTGDPLRTAMDKSNDNFTELYNGAGGVADGAVTTAKLAADAVDSDKIADGAVDTVHIADSNITTAKLADDSVTTVKITDANVTTAKLADDSVSFEKVDVEFTTSSGLTAGATVDVDFDAAQVFTLTPNANTTFNITNPKIGVTKTIIVTGAGSTYTADTWTVGGGAGTFNRIAGEYDDTSSTKNFYQITCISATEFWYSISQIAS